MSSYELDAYEILGLNSEEEITDEMVEESYHEKEEKLQEELFTLQEKKEEIESELKQNRENTKWEESILIDRKIQYKEETKEIERLEKDRKKHRDQENITKQELLKENEKILKQISKIRINMIYLKEAFTQLRDQTSRSFYRRKYYSEHARKNILTTEERLNARLPIDVKELPTLDIRKKVKAYNDKETNKIISQEEFETIVKNIERNTEKYAKKIKEQEKGLDYMPQTSRKKGKENKEEEREI